MSDRLEKSLQWAQEKAANRKPEADQSLIYFVLAGPYLKVGISTKRMLRERIKSIQTGNPHWVKLLKAVYVDDPRQAERQFHEALEMYHVRGEWFELPENHPIMKLLLLP